MSPLSNKICAIVCLVAAILLLKSVGVVLPEELLPLLRFLISS